MNLNRQNVHALAQQRGGDADFAQVAIAQRQAILVLTVIKPQQLAFRSRECFQRIVIRQGQRVRLVARNMPPDRFLAIHINHHATPVVQGETARLHLRGVLDFELAAQKHHRRAPLPALGSRVVVLGRLGPRRLGQAGARPGAVVHVGAGPVRRRQRRRRGCGRGNGSHPQRPIAISSQGRDIPRRQLAVGTARIGAARDQEVPPEAVAIQHHGGV